MRIAAFRVWSLVLVLELVLGWGGGARAASAQAPQTTTPATLSEPGLKDLAHLQADRHERAGIGAQRQRLEAEFAVEERACAGRFVVSGCVDDVRKRRRVALAPLRERELQLDAAERRQRADNRRAAVAAKTTASASRPAAPEPAADARERAADSREREPAVPPASSVSGPAARPRFTPPAAAARAAEAEERAREGRVREQQVQESEQRIRRRLDDREARGRKADPLPVPQLAPSAAAR